MWLQGVSRDHANSNARASTPQNQITFEMLTSTGQCDAIEAQIQSHTCWRRKWQPTPVLLPGKSYGQRSLVGYSPWGRKESDMTERLHLTLVENYLDCNNCSHLVLAVCFYICNYIMNFVSKWIRHLSYKWLFMLLQFPLPPLAITQGPWLRDPQYEDKENMLPQQFRVYNPFPAGRSYRTISPPLSLATIFS